MDDLTNYFDKRPRSYQEIDLKEHIPGAPSARCNFRVLTYAEILEANAKALQYVAETYKDRDPGKGVTESIIGAFQVAMSLTKIKPANDAAAQAIKSEVPVFANGKDVMGKVTGHELGVLVRLLTTAAHKASGVNVDLSPDQLGELTKSLATFQKQDRITGALLSPYSSAELAELLVRASMMMHPEVVPYEAPSAADAIPEPESAGSE